MSSFVISPIAAQRTSSTSFQGSSPFAPATFSVNDNNNNNNNIDNNNMLMDTSHDESKRSSSIDKGIINQSALNHQHRLHAHVNNSQMLKGNIPLKSNNFFKPILNPSKTKHKRTREEQSVDDSIRADNNSNNNNNNRLGVNKNVDAEESLFKSFKRCKITRSSGELRLKKDVQDVISNLTSGHVEILQIPKDPLRFNLVIHRVWPSNLNRVSTATFLCKVSRFYPHEAPRIYLKEKLDYTCSKDLFISEEDGQIDMPILHKDNWNPIYTLCDVIFHLVSLLHIENNNNVYNNNDNNKNNSNTMDEEQMSLEQSSVSEPLFSASSVAIGHIPALPKGFISKLSFLKR